MVLCYINGSVNIHEFVRFSNMIVLPYILELSLKLAFGKVIPIDKCVLICRNYEKMKEDAFCMSFLNADVVWRNIADKRRMQWEPIYLRK